jgi:hypothetical protein
MVCLSLSLHVLLLLFFLLLCVILLVFVLWGWLIQILLYLSLIFLMMSKFFWTWLNILVIDSMLVCEKYNWTWAVIIMWVCVKNIIERENEHLSVTVSVLLEIEHLQYVEHLSVTVNTWNWALITYQYVSLWNLTLEVC